MFPVCDTPTLFPDLPDMPHPSAPVAPVLLAKLDAQVLDALVDALMAGASSHARADVVCAVVEELCASVAWLKSAGLSAAESASLQRVLIAAQDHRQQMLVASRSEVDLVPG